MQERSCGEIFSEFVRREAVDPKKSTVSGERLELCLGRWNKKGRFSSRYGRVIVQAPASVGRWTFTFRPRGRDWVLALWFVTALITQNLLIALLGMVGVFFAVVDYVASVRQVREVMREATGAPPRFVLVLSAVRKPASRSSVK